MVGWRAGEWVTPTVAMKVEHSGMYLAGWSVTMWVALWDIEMAGYSVGELVHCSVDTLVFVLAAMSDPMKAV